MFKLHPQLKADTFDLGDLAICKVLLMNESKFPWLILVPRRENVSELYHLDQSDVFQANQESLDLSKLLMDYFGGDKMNIAALGNLVPQLHVHHIVRNKDDEVWPQPVWGNFIPTQYSHSAGKELCDKLAELFESSLPGFTKC